MAKSWPAKLCWTVTVSQRINNISITTLRTKVTFQVQPVQWLRWHLFFMPCLLKDTVILPSYWWTWISIGLDCICIHVKYGLKRNMNYEALFILFLLKWIFLLSSRFFLSLLGPVSALVLQFKLRQNGLRDRFNFLLWVDVKMQSNTATMWHLNAIISN